MLISGKAPEFGEIMSLPNLAKTYRIISEKGKAGFYEGEVAEAIIDLIQSQGGVMTLSDLKNHKTEEVEPISYTYKEQYKLFECPPNGQGITTLIALGILETLEKEKKIKNLEDMEFNSTEYLHVLIEALRIGFKDTRYHVTDPDFYKLKPEELLSEVRLY